MSFTSTQRLAAIEARIFEALEPLTAEDPIQSMGVVKDVACQLSAYVADIGVMGETPAARAMARDHLLKFVGHAVQLLEHFDELDREARLN